MTIKKEYLILEMCVLPTERINQINRIRKFTIATGADVSLSIKDQNIFLKQNPKYGNVLRRSYHNPQIRDTTFPNLV